MDFLTFARANGVLIRDLDCSGVIRRCPTELHPKARNGAYSWDGVRGWVMAWDGDAKAIWFDRPGEKPDAKELAKRSAIIAQQRQEQAMAHQRAADQAKAMLASCIPSDHPYLHAKGLGRTEGLVLPDGGLFVPMRSLDGFLVGAQVIRERHDGFDKRMLPGMKAKGAIFRIGPQRASKTILCEGYATGLSIEAASRQMRQNAAVLVCFSAGNIEYVAPMVKGAKGVFADNDKSKRGEQAAKTAGLSYVMSDIEGEDANDLHQRAGIFAVARKLQELST